MVENYEKIDDAVAAAILDLCIDYLLSCGARERNGKYFFADGDLISINIPPVDNIGRTLTIYFISSKTHGLSEVSDEYSYFGTLPKITLSYPARLNSTIRQLLERIHKFISLAYTLWEKTYISKFTDWGYKRKKILLNGIYELIETEIERNNPRFKNKVWLSIIELEKNGESGKFVFEFNESFLKDMIKDLKRNQTLRFSPMVIISNLITKNVVDEQTGKYRDGIFTFQTTVDDLQIQFDNETYLFWLASMLIYTNEAGTGMGCHTIAREGRFLLSVDHSAYNQEMVIQLIAPVMEQIIEIFGQNVQAYRQSPISKITFKLADNARLKLIPLSSKIKEVFIEKSIEQIGWEPLKHELANLARHCFETFWK